MLIQDDRYDVSAYSQSKLNASGIPRSSTPYEERGLGKIGYTFRDAARWSREFSAYVYNEHFRSPRKCRCRKRIFLQPHPHHQQPVRFRWRPSEHDILLEDVVCLWRRLPHGRSLVRQRTLHYQQENGFNHLFHSQRQCAAGLLSGFYNVGDGFVIARFQPLRKLTISAGGRLESTHMKSSPVHRMP
jgi:hemoglobin/transferrin/lactoferrin receptor protein